MSVPPAFLCSGGMEGQHGHYMAGERGSAGYFVQLLVAALHLKQVQVLP